MENKTDNLNQTLDAYDSVPGLLIALPSLKDPYFEKTVVMLLSFSEEGAFGLLVNAPSKVLVKEIVSDKLPIMNQLNVPLLIGGPVQPEYVWAIHSSDFSGETTDQVGSAIHVSTMQEVLSAMTTTQGPKVWHLGCGYAGWGPDQLDREIQDGAWWLAPLDPQLVLNLPYEKRWETALTNIGVDPFNSGWLAAEEDSGHRPVS